MIEMVEIPLQLESRSACECFGCKLGQCNQFGEEVKAFPCRGTSQMSEHRGQEPFETAEGIGLSDEPVDREGIALFCDIGQVFV